MSTLGLCQTLWPLGFGSDDKARKYLQKGLALNPDGINPNYGYGEYCSSREHLLKAQKADPRLGRSLADRVCQLKIEASLSKVAIKLDG